MNSIIYDEVITPKNDKWKYYDNFTNRLEQRDCVKLALFCAKIANNNSKESNLCIGLVEKWLVDEKSVSREELHAAANSASYAAIYTVADAADAAYAATFTVSAAVYASCAASDYIYIYSYSDNIDIVNKYLQILLRKTKQFQNNKILEQISKTDVDRLELVDWNMITDIMLEEYNIIHEFDYEDIFSRRCLIELLRREYT